MSPEARSGPDIGLTGARFGGAPRRKAMRRAAAAGSRTPEQETGGSPAPAANPAPAADPTPTARVGITAAGPGAAATGGGDADIPDDPVVGLTGARFGGVHRRRRPPMPPAAVLEVQPPVPTPSPTPPPALPGVEPGPEILETFTSFVRPYVLTCGRTRSCLALSIETLVSAVPMGARGPETTEHEAVVALCYEPRSVAEVAALLGVPLGVARVLLGDLVATGFVVVHDTVGADGPDLALMERVLTGLRRL